MGRLAYAVLFAGIYKPVHISYLLDAILNRNVSEKLMFKNILNEKNELDNSEADHWRH